MSGPSAAALRAALTVATVMGFSETKVRSTTETLGVGTRMAKPSSLPSISGMTSLRALAAPVLEWNHAESGGAGAAEVLVRRVEDDLVIGVAVDRGHDAGGDAEGVVEDLDDGCEAVGGAARVGDDVVFGGVVLIVVDAEDDGDVLIGGRGGDDDLLDGAAEVGFGFFRVGEEAGGFDDDLGADGGPVELGRVALGENFDLLAVDGDEVGAVGDLVWQVAEDGVVLEQVGQGGGGGEVVYGYEFDVWVAESAAEDVASDAAEAVDAYLYCCHDFGCSCRDAAGVFAGFDV